MSNDSFQILQSSYIGIFFVMFDKLLIHNLCLRELVSFVEEKRRIVEEEKDNVDKAHDIETEVNE